MSVDYSDSGSESLARYKPMNGGYFCLLCEKVVVGKGIVIVL